MESKTKVGIVGLENWYHSLPLVKYCMESEDYELVGVVDETTVHLEEFARDYNIKNVYSNLHTFLDNQKMDVVVVNNATSDHEDVIKVVAQRGIHILCDKPMATTTQGAKQIIQIAENSKIKLGILHNFRFSPTLIELKKKIESNIIGQPRSITYSLRARLPEDWPGSGDPGWYADRKRAGGGAFADHAAHTIDAICWILGTNIKSVDAQMANLVHKDLDVEDYGIAVIRYKNEIMVTVESTWTAQKILGSSEMLQVIGDTGEIFASRFFQPNICIKAHLKGFNPPVSYNVAEPVWTENLKRAFDNFVASIKGKEKLRTSAEDGAVTVQIIEAAYKSADSGHTIIL